MQHLASEPQNLSNPGNVALLSDRDPLSLVERHRRRNLHRLMLNGPPQQEGEEQEEQKRGSVVETASAAVERSGRTAAAAAKLSTSEEEEKNLTTTTTTTTHPKREERRRIPFNRKLLEDSLAEYGQERLVMNNLVGATHQPGRRGGELFPPYVKYFLAKPEDDSKSKRRVTFVLPRQPRGVEGAHDGAYDYVSH